MIRRNVFRGNWHDIPFDQRQEMLKKANLLDDKGRLTRPLTRQIKMMVVNQYYDADNKVVIK